MELPAQGPSWQVWLELRVRGVGRGQITPNLGRSLGNEEIGSYKETEEVR